MMNMQMLLKEIVKGVIARKKTNVSLNRMIICAFVGIKALLSWLILWSVVVVIVFWFFIYLIYRICYFSNCLTSFKFFLNLVPRSTIDDEYANANERDPKILLTTSHDPSAPLKQFVKVCLFAKLLFCQYVRCG